MSTPAEQRIRDVAERRRASHAAYVAAMDDAERAAYEQGRSAFQSCSEPSDTLHMLNPFDGDEQPELFDAWDAGFGDA